MKTYSSPASIVSGGQTPGNIDNAMKNLTEKYQVFFPGLGKSQKIPVLAIQLIPSRDIIDKKIQQSDWTGGTPGHIQQRVVVSDATFPC